MTARYFLESNNGYDYIVKCSLCDNDGTNLMEISVPVATKEQAQIICNNWKNNVSRLYGTIFSALVSNGK